MVWLKEKIAQVQELKRLRKEYNIKYEENYQLYGKSCIGDVRQNMKFPQRIVLPSWGSALWPCMVIQQGYEIDFWLAALSGDWSGYSYEFYCPNFNKDTPCTKCDCMHYQANQNHFIQEKLQDELFDLNKKIDAAKKRIWGRTK